MCIKQFLRDEHGSVTIEMLLILPLLIWAYVATFVFFDGFRSDSTNVKTSYTIADILSRETSEPITPTYLDSLYGLQEFLSRTSAGRLLRVTAMRYVEADDTYRVVWSQVRGNILAHTDNSIAALRAEILPIMSDGETNILVESARDYIPLLAGYGLAPFRMQEAMVVRPRFSQTICWSDNEAGPWTIDDQTC